MAIRKLPNGKWQVQVDVGRKLDGSRDRRSKTCKTKREAVQAEAELNALRIVSGGVTGRVTLRWFVESVWIPEKEPLCTYETMAAYKRHLNNQILPALGDMDISAIKHLHVQRMITSCATWKVARNAKSTLYNVLQMAVELGAAPSNAAASRSFRYPPKGERAGRQHGEWLTSFEQHRRLIDAARGTPAFPIVALGLCFGLRKGEILGLDWEDIDLEAGWLHVRRTYVKGADGPTEKEPKTDNATRDIPISDYAAGLLREMGPGSGPVVHDADGNRVSPRSAVSIVGRLVKSGGVPEVTILSLRHSFATTAIRAGANVISVSKWLGHASITTTLDRYVRPLQRDLKADVADVLDAGMANLGN